MSASYAELRIEPAAEADRDTLLALSRAMNAEDGHPLDARAEGAVKGLLRPETPAWAWLLCEAAGGAAVGYVVVTAGYSIEHGGMDGFVDELYVSPAARGRGWGRRLLQFAHAAARSKGIGTLHLEVEAGNDRAASLYRSLGYAGTGRSLLSKRLDPAP